MFFKLYKTILCMYFRILKVLPKRARWTTSRVPQRLSITLKWKSTSLLEWYRDLSLGMSTEQARCFQNRWREVKAFRKLSLSEVKSGRWWQLHTHLADREKGKFFEIFFKKKMKKNFTKNFEKIDKNPKIQKMNDAVH